MEYPFAPEDGQPLVEFVRKHAITATFSKAKNNPNLVDFPPPLKVQPAQEKKTADAQKHARVFLHRPGTEEVFMAYFSAGSGFNWLDSENLATSLIGAIWMDSTYDLEEWYGMLGIEPGGPWIPRNPRQRPEHLYRLVQKQAARLQEWLGNEAWEEVTGGGYVY